MMTVELLQAPFVKPWNEDYAGHVLATRRQRSPLCSTVCTAANETSHRRFFGFSRLCYSGASYTWTRPLHMTASRQQEGTFGR